MLNHNLWCWGLERVTLALIVAKPGELWATLVKNTAKFLLFLLKDCIQSTQKKLTLDPYLHAASKISCAEDFSVSLMYAGNFLKIRQWQENF